MGSGLTVKPSRERFIYLGLTKDKWTGLTPEVIQSFMDNPEILDHEDEEFVERFFYYFDWYNNEN